MRDWITGLCDWNSFKVAFALAAPPAVAAYSPERILGIVSLAAGAAYAWLKVWRLYHGKEK